MERESSFEKIEKIKMAYRVLILLGTVALLGGLFVLLVAAPKMGEIESTQNQITKLNRDIRNAKRQVKKLEEKKEKVARMEAEFREKLKILPEKREIPSLLTRITELGEESRLVFENFTPQNEDPKDFYVEIPVNIAVTGRYHDVAMFFNRVRNMARIVNVFDVSMTPTDKESYDLTTTCKAVTYRFKGKGQKGG